VEIPLAGTIPQLVFVAFQLMFAIITVALVSGAIADRLKVRILVGLRGLWATFVYFPVAHWVFAFDGFTGEHGGWIANKLKAIDFAGGTAGAYQLRCRRSSAVSRSRASARAGPEPRCGRTTCRS